MRSSLSISTGGDGLGDALNGVLSPGNAQPVQPGSVPKPLRRIKPLRELHTRLNIFNVTQLDTKKQIFTANLYYEVAWEPSTPADRAWVMAWTDAKEDNLARAELEKKENMPFDPKVHFANMDVDPVSEERFVAYEENYSGKGISFICERKKLMGASFNNQLALKHFPFDVQDLSIKVRTDQPLDKARLVANVYLPCDGRPSEFTTSNEFTYDSKIYYQNRLEKGARGGGAFTLVAFRLKANRKPGFVIFNVFVPILFISVLGLTVFTIDEVEPNEDFEKRFVVNGSLLLTLVAYKFSTSNNLPAVNYQTFGDKYVLFSVFLQVALVAWSAILVNFVTDDRDGVDRNAFIVFSAVFALWIVCFWLSDFVSYFVPNTSAVERFEAKFEAKRDKQCREECGANFAGPDQTCPKHGEVRWVACPLKPELEEDNLERNGGLQDALWFTDADAPAEAPGAPAQHGLAGAPPLTLNGAQAPAGEPENA